MNNTLLSLNNYLFEQLERLNDDDLTDEQLERELKKADGVVRISEQITKNSELALKAIKHMDDKGYSDIEKTSRMLTEMVKN